MSSVIRKALKSPTLGGALGFVVGARTWARGRCLLACGQGGGLQVATAHAVANKVHGYACGVGLGGKQGVNRCWACAACRCQCGPPCLVVRGLGFVHLARHQGHGLQNKPTTHRHHGGGALGLGGGRLGNHGGARATRQAEEAEVLRRLGAGERIEQYETVRITADGRELPVSLTLSPVRDVAGTIVGASKIVRDISQQKQAEAALKLARDEAEAANRAKDDFLAVLSHELRTPLTPVLAATTDMETSPPSDPAELRENLAMIRRNIELEARLVDDLLDVTRIKHGKLRIQSVPVDLHVTLRDALAGVEPILREKGIALTTELADGPQPVRGDGARLAQVFSNLLGNAAKFTPEAGRIGVRTSRSAGQVRVEVSDSGIGIAADSLAGVFEPFRQEATTRLFGGLGLGLSVAKSLVEAHGGTIVVRSAGRGRGATFTVTLPVLATQTVPAITPAATTAPAQQTRALRVLLVEDHEDTRMILRRLLTRWGHTVTTAGCVAEARLALADGTFDLLLSDVGLPDGTGMDVVTILREKSRIPAVAMSGYGMEADIARTRDAGFDEHLVKPVAADLLRELVTRLSASADRPADRA